MSSVESDSQSTVHYAKPVIRHHQIGTSSSPIFSNSSNPRSPNIRYPTVVVPDNGSSSSHNSPKSCPSYAVPIPRHKLHQQYSTSQLQYEHMRHRCKMLDEENQKLMKIQWDVVNDSNRRVQMHVNEIRALKEENKKFQMSNKELRDLCCFLDDDRQKTRRLAREWQKFGRYTSNLMKQEVQSYHHKLTNLEEKLTTKEHEVDELRQLCMYLDEQRQCLMNSVQHNQSIRSDDESEDLGCGSSEQSGASNDEKDYFYSKHKETTLRRISEQMANSMISSSVSDEERKEETKREKSRLVGYIQSLENRIKHLEMSQNHESFWNSSSNIGSDCDEKTVIERNWLGEEENDTTIEEIPITKNHENTSMRIGNMFASMASTMSSSGCTTYASSGTDAESVFVMGDELDIGSLEVRTLSRIEEEADKNACSTMNDSVEENEILKESAKMPPKIAPAVCSNLLSNVAFEESPKSISLMRSASETCRPTTTLISATGTLRCSSVEKSPRINNLS